MRWFRAVLCGPLWTLGRTWGHLGSIFVHLGPSRSPIDIHTPTPTMITYCNPCGVLCVCCVLRVLCVSRPSRCRWLRLLPLFHPKLKNQATSACVPRRSSCPSACGAGAASLPWSGLTCGPNTRRGSSAGGLILAAGRGPPSPTGRTGGGDAEAEWEAGEVGEVVEAEVVDSHFELLD